MQTLVQLRELQDFEFVGDLTGLLPSGSVFSSSAGRSTFASLASVFDAEMDGSSFGSGRMPGGLGRSPAAAAAGSGGLRVMYNGPSVLSLLPQLSNLSSLVLEQWTGAFTSIGKFG
jgi:hypothetical protein